MYYGSLFSIAVIYNAFAGLNHPGRNRQFPARTFYVYARRVLPFGHMLYVCGKEYAANKALI